MKDLYILKICTFITMVFIEIYHLRHMSYRTVWIFIANACLSEVLGLWEEISFYNKTQSCLNVCNAVL